MNYPRLIEFVLLCVVLPTIIIVGRFAPYMFAFLWAATIYCALAYRYFALVTPHF